MTKPSRPPREIDGKGRTIRELIAGRKYSIGYRQREYKCPHAKYTQRGRKGYEMQQLWVHHSQLHVEGFAHLREFAKHRNHIRGLLLLPKSFTASYGDLPYAEKREHYLKQNLLACSLHERTYDRNPSFRRFIEESGLPFRAHAEFQKEVLDARQDLYRRLAGRIWDPERLAREAAS